MSWLREFFPQVPEDDLRLSSENRPKRMLMHEKYIFLHFSVSERHGASSENAGFLLVGVPYTKVSLQSFGERETTHSGKERAVRRAKKPYGRLLLIPSPLCAPEFVGRLAFCPSQQTTLNHGWKPRQDLGNARVQYSLQQNEYPQMGDEASQAERTSRRGQFFCKRSCTPL
jgi:hypothetical protein